jgi:hypothetical protein
MSPFAVVLSVESTRRVRCPRASTDLASSLHSPSAIRIFRPDFHGLDTRDLQDRAFSPEYVMGMLRTFALLATLVSSATGVGCAFDHSSNMLGPSSSRASGAATPPGSNGVATPSMVGLWESNALPTLPSPTSCGNFQYQISSQTATSIAGTFTAVCGGGLSLSGSATGQLVGSSVPFTITGNASLPGIPSCAISLSGTGAIEDSGRTLRLPYAGTTCLGPVTGTEVLRKPTPATTAPPAPPSPPQPPPPPPPPVPTSNDGIDLHGVTVTAASPADVANWPVTTLITTLDLRGDGAFVDFSKKDGPGRWPDVMPPGWDGPIQYTLWLVENINGRWYTSGGVEYWYGLSRQGGPPSQYGRNWYYSSDVWGPLANHQPAIGEQVGFFVTAGDARAKDVTIVRERSNVVVVPFPSDAGSVFQFSAARLGPFGR